MENYAFVVNGEISHTARVVEGIYQEGVSYGNALAVKIPKSLEDVDTGLLYWDGELKVRSQKPAEYYEWEEDRWIVDLHRLKKYAIENLQQDQKFRLLRIGEYKIPLTQDNLEEIALGESPCLLETTSKQIVEISATTVQETMNQLVREKREERRRQLALQKSIEIATTAEEIYSLLPTLFTADL